jgi:two-component system, OmpR family, phosphate regulon sensor histidine kinase PhoR
MKPGRTYLFIAISSAALLLVLLIQVNWILQTAKIKEQLFREKANMVLSRTADALSSDQQACRAMEDGLGTTEKQKTDSLFTNYMSYYNLKTDYSFDVTSPGASVAEGKSVQVYSKRLEEEATRNGLELSLFIPGKSQLVTSEMGPMFLTSVVLILIVLVLFWKTMRSLLHEKKVAQQTTDFLNNMTHEFRTPLTNIALAGKMIGREPALHSEEKVKHYSRIILEENEKLRLQVDQVLSMTALERGEVVLHKTKVDIHELLRDAARCMGVQMEERGGRLQLELNAANSTFYADQVHFSGAVCNLIDNALKYSPETPDITIRSEDKGAGIQITVSDRGIGISKEHQQKVFEKFYRIPTGDVHDVKGFGLGLSYVHKIVELHGGTISVESGEGTGTTFIINLGSD